MKRHAPTLPNLAFVRELGEGATSRVFLFEAERPRPSTSPTDPADPADKKRRDLVVVKQRSTRNSKSRELAALREAMLLREFATHPCVLRFLDVVVTRDALCLVTAFAPNGDLASRLVQIKRKALSLPARQAQSWLAQLALALQALHAKGVLHRDVKPANVFILRDNRVVLGDLGASRIVPATDLAQTRTGTPLYMSPELLRGDPYGPASDVWALGCIAFELATLHRPFETSSIRELRELVDAHAVAWHRLDAANVAGTSPLRRVARSTLVPDPALRPTTDRLLRDPAVAVGVASFVRDCAAGAFQLSKPERVTLLRQLRDVGLGELATCAARLGKMDARQPRHDYS